MIPWWVAVVSFFCGAMSGIFLLAIVSAGDEEER